MLHTKTAANNSQRRRGLKLLTKEELTEIRNFLPKYWRKQIAEKHGCLNVRQITEVFNQRTKNVKDNLVVWQTINELLDTVAHKKVKSDVQQVLFFWQHSHNVMRSK